MIIFLEDFETGDKYYEFNNAYKVEVKCFLENEYDIVTEIIGSIQPDDICIYVYLDNNQIFVFNYYEYLLNVPIKTNLTPWRSKNFQMKQ